MSNSLWPFQHFSKNPWISNPLYSFQLMPSSQKKQKPSQSRLGINPCINGVITAESDDAPAGPPPPPQSYIIFQPESLSTSEPTGWSLQSESGLQGAASQASHTLCSYITFSCQADLTQVYEHDNVTPGNNRRPTQVSGPVGTRPPVG